MIAYSPADLAHHLARARAQGIRLRATGRPLTYQATSSQPNQPGYVVRVSPDLMSAACSCPSPSCCKHGAAGISAARKARAHDAAQTLRRHQMWTKQLAAAAA